jgi:hypothetical protein
MDSLGIRMLEALLAVTFILLTIQKKNGMWLFSAVVFTLTAAFIKHSIDIRDVKDFAPYFASFRAVKNGTVPTELLVEPYRLALFKVVEFFGNTDDLSQIGLIYYFHFLVVTGFFVWLAYLKEVTFELKLVLFLAFFPTMAFVWIRSGMVYVASCVLFLNVTSRRFRVLHFLLPLIHASVTPLVVAMKIKDFSPMRKGLIILASVVAGFFILESSYVQYIIHKLDRYSETSDRRTSIDLLLFHAANILTFIYLALINSKFRKNFVVLVLMGTYILLYFVNPIVGIRVFPLVLIAGIVQRISFPRYQHLTLWVCAAYLPVYFARFDQIFI